MCSEIRSVEALNNFKQIKTSRVSLGSISLLTGQGIVQTCTTGGLLWLQPGQHVSVHAQVGAGGQPSRTGDVQVTGPVHVLAGSQFSGINLGWVDSLAEQS